MSRLPRIAFALSSMLVTLALLAPMAMAESDHGEGTYGETTDKVVTNAGYILIIFFPLFITVMTLLQTKLEKRKQHSKVAAKHRNERFQGW